MKQMKSKYKVVDSFFIKDETVLVLDKKWDPLACKKLCIDCEGEIIPFGLTHNEYWITLQGKKDLTDHYISFC